MRKSLILLILMFVAIVSCDGSSVSERVSSAEMALAAEDVATARRICDELVGEDVNTDGSIAATELGRLSILYMQLYDRTDDSDALDLATKCFRESFKENADSATYYYSHLPAEQDRYAISLAVLVHAVDNPADISDVDTDSLVNEYDYN